MGFDFENTILDSIAQFGETVTYTSLGGDVARIDGLWQESPPDIEPRQDGDHEDRTETVTIRYLDVPYVEINATVLRALTGETWRVEKFQNLRGVAIKLTLSRALTVRKTKTQYART